MLELVQWASDAFWLRCFTGILILTFVGVFYNMPKMYGHTILCLVIALLVIGLSDLLFSFVHPLLWVISGIVALTMVVRGFIEEHTELGQELRELREMKEQQREFHEQMQRGLSDEELQGILMGNDEDDREGDDTEYFMQ